MVKLSNAPFVIVCTLSLTIGFMSCSNSSEEMGVEYATGRPIVFEIEIDNTPHTRGSFMLINDLTEYGVYGVNGKTAFATNILYKKVEGEWTKSKTFMWPSTTSNFYSVNASFAKESAGGIMDKVTVNGTKQAFTYTVPESTEDQFDLMVASALGVSEGDNDGKVKLSFKRVLAYLNFTIVNKMEGNYLVTIGGISAYNMKNSGTFTFSKTSQSAGAWVEGSTYGKMERVFEEPFVVPTTKDYLVDKDTVFMIVPQAKTTKWKTKGTAAVPTSEADANGHTYVKLLCKIQDEGGNYLFGSADEYGDVYLPFNVSQTKQATVSTYAINFSGGYDINGVPLSFGSGLDIEPEDWVVEESDPIDIEF